MERLLLLRLLLPACAVVSLLWEHRACGLDFATDGDSVSAATESDAFTGIGPCGCLDRNTLLQWSYGTSFGGGASLDEPLVTDRPDFTECSSTVGRGVVQIEGGYTFYHDRAEARTTHVHTVGEPLLRYGLVFDWLEFRVATGYVHESRSDSGATISDGGASDLYLGLKIALTPQEGILPEMALTPQMLLPSGSEPFSEAGDAPPGDDNPTAPDRVAPGINWLYSWVLNDRWRIGGSTQCNRSKDDETARWYALAAQSAVVGYSVRDDFELYGEWFSLMPIDADSVKPEHYLSGGMIYYLTDNLQVDLRGGLGMCDAADDFFVGAGGAVRFGRQR